MIGAEVICACCGELGEHNGRNLRKECYDRHYHAGTLHQFPKVSTWIPTLGRLDDFAELRGRGMSVKKAAAKLGMSSRSGWRYEARLKARQAVNA